MLELRLWCGVVVNIYSLEEMNSLSVDLEGLHSVHETR